MKYRRRFLAALVLACTAGCQSSPAADPANAPPASYDAPPACAGNFGQRAGTLKLENTRPPKDLNDSKSAALPFASTINVSKPLDALARTTRFDNGWSSMALSIQSLGAQSLSVHLSNLVLPRGSEIWLCAPDGSRSEGPYREAVGGDVWTPVIQGDVAWLDVLVPTAKAGQFKATLAEVFGGFR